MSIEVYSAIVTTGGLIMDILGVLVLTVFQDSVFRIIFKTMNTYNGGIPDDVKKNAKRTTIIGVVLIMAGFVLQIIGSWMF